MFDVFNFPVDMFLKLKKQFFRLRSERTTLVNFCIKLYKVRDWITDFLNEKIIPKSVLVTWIKMSAWPGSLMFRAKNVKMIANELSSRPARAVFNPPRLFNKFSFISVSNSFRFVEANLENINYLISSWRTPTVIAGFFFRMYLLMTVSSALLYWNFRRNMSYLGIRVTSSFVSTRMSAAEFKGDLKLALTRKRYAVCDYRSTNINN